MLPIVLLFAISLLRSYDARGSDIVTPVFVHKGKDLLLDILTPVNRVDRDEFKWKYNDTKNIIRLFFDNTTEHYLDRVIFFPLNYSLLLKNVKQADSGYYTAGVFGKNDVSVAKYSVTVQDPVSLVHGNVSVSLSSDSCNLTVTCSTQDSHHINSTFRCDADTCSQGGERSKVTTSGASLRVYLSNGSSIICNHSNHVSLAEDIIMTRRYCISGSASKPPRTVIAWSMFAFIGAVGVAIAVFFKLQKKRRKQQSMDCKNTVYETVQIKTATQHLDQTPPELQLRLESSIYSLVESG